MVSAETERKPERKLTVVPSQDQRTRVPGALPWSYKPGVGVWRDQGTQILTWCPVVTRHLAAWSGRGEIVGRRFTIKVGGESATVPHDQVADGSCWSRFPAAIGAGGRDERQALLAIVEDQAHRLELIPLHPRWADGALVLPPADALMRGYTDTTGSWSDWCAMVRTVVDSPRIAMVMGLAVGGLYVQPLGRQSYVVHMGGGSSVGKTTTAEVTASIFGSPGDVIEAWSGTVNSVTAQLRGLHCLTAFRDELGASGFRAEQLSALMFRVTQGAERAVSTRTGEYRESQGSWHGAVISTGNHSIVGGIANEGIAARVIEPPLPMTSSAAHSDALRDMVSLSYGHGLVALADAKVSPAVFAVWAREAGAAIPLPGGGPERRIGEHLAMGVAGARLLAQVTGVPELVDAAIVAARETLAELVARLEDHGVRPGDRLLAAVAGAVASNPGAFPTRRAYEMAIATDRAPREVWGWDLTNDQLPGEIAIIDKMMRKITDPQGIEDAGIALRELDGRGDLIRPAARGCRNLARDIKVNGKKFRAYHLRNVFTQSDDESEAAVTVEDQVPTNSEPVPTSVPTSKTTVDQGGPYSPYICGSDVLGEGEPVNGDAPLMVTVVREYLTCPRCGEPTRVRVNGAPGHGGPCRPAERNAEASGVPGGSPVTPTAPTAAHGDAEAVSGPIMAQPDAEELSNFRRALADRFGDALDVDAVPAALAVWHDVTDGLRFVSYPGQVGVAAYSRLVARHGSMPDPQRCESELVEQISTGGKCFRSLGWLDKSAVLDADMALTCHDIRSQFLAAARAVELGDGEPAHYVAPRTYAGLLKLPGYLLLGSNLDCPWPAFADVTAGTWLPMPVATYLHQRGIRLDVTEAVVWQQKGRRLAAWAGGFATALQALQDRTDTPSAYAEAAVKEVYAAFLGGMLRSERYNTTGTMRKDWSDQMIALADMNALRNLDRATYGFPYGTTDSVVAKAITGGASPVVRPLGMCRDAVWHVAPSAPFEVPGLAAVDKDGQSIIQPGKFRLQKWCAVTPEIIEAHADGSPYRVRDAINAAVKERS